jgi:hypothetical protein
VKTLFEVCVILDDGLNQAARPGLRVDLDTFAEGDTFDYFRQLILAFLNAARFRCRHH